MQLSQNNYQASIDNELKLIELDPNFGIAYDTLGLAYLKAGRRSEAVAALEKSAQLTGRYGLVLSDLGYAYAVTGKRAEALAIIKELEERYTRQKADGINVAAVYAGLGDKDKAFEAITVLLLQWLDTFNCSGEAFEALQLLEATKDAILSERFNEALTLLLGVLSKAEEVDGSR